MRFSFEADMVKGQCYRCPLWQEDYYEDDGWAEYCRLDHSVEYAGEDPSECPLKEFNEIVWHPYPNEKPTLNGLYLVSFNFEDNYPLCVDSAEWDAEDGKFRMVGWGIDYIVHAWAELPRPYLENPPVR